MTNMAALLEPTRGSVSRAQSPAAAGPAQVTIVFCVESGGLEAMTVRAVASLRKWGGRFAGCRVLAITPRLGPGLNRATLGEFERLNVERIRIHPPNRYAWFSFTNKQWALLEAQKLAGTDQICWLDSDLLVLSEPNELELSDDIQWAACASDKSIGVAGESDPNVAYWREICQLVGLKLDELPWVRAHRENVDIRFYFNSGVFIFRKSTDFLQNYLDFTARAMDARLASHVSGIYFNEQAMLGLAAVKLGLQWRALPESYNYAVGPKIAQWYDSQKIRETKILHYHGAMWPAYWPTLMSQLKTDRPELHDWLVELGPLQNPAGVLRHSVGKLLAAARRRQAARHQRACRVI